MSLVGDSREDADSCAPGSAVESHGAGGGAIGEAELQLEALDIFIGMSNGQVPLQLCVVLSHYYCVEVGWVRWWDWRQRNVLKLIFDHKDA